MASLHSYFEWTAKYQVKKGASVINKMKAFGVTEIVVNVVPPSTAKRRGSSCSSRKSDGSNNGEDDNTAGQRPNKKRIKKSSSVEKQPPAAEPAAFDKLDPKDPVQAKRIQQRRKAISKGKNTAGYDAYIRQVSKESRRPRSMATPATPDPTIDISQKRWNGQVRAWYVSRVLVTRWLCCVFAHLVFSMTLMMIHQNTHTHRRKALHQYDPPDLLNNSQASASSSSSSSNSSKNEDAVAAMDVNTTSFEFETAQTTTRASAVPATPTPCKRPYVRFCDDDDDASSIMDHHSPLSVKSDYSGKRSLNDLEEVGDGGDDSDDDLL